MSVAYTGAGRNGRLGPVTEAPHIYAAPSGRMGRAPMSQIDLIASQVSQEELAEWAAEQRKRELLDAGRRGFTIGTPDDFDWETFRPWVVKVDDQIRRLGLPRPVHRCSIDSSFHLTFEGQGRKVEAPTRQVRRQCGEPSRAAPGASQRSHAGLRG
jgi:hypothetical protein